MLEKNITYLRKQKGLTQEQLAKELGVSRQTIVKWEKGIVVPDTYNLIEISKFFSVKVQELITTEIGFAINVSTSESDSEQDFSKEKIVLGKSSKIEKRKSHNWKLLSIVTFAIIVATAIGAVLFKDDLAHLLNKNTDNTNLGNGNENTDLDVIMNEENVAMISAGRNFSVFMDNDGDLTGYGENTYKQLNFEDWTDIKEVSAGGFHTLGLKKDGTVLATGYNEYNQLDVKSWKEIEHVSAGRYHSMGLKSDGSVLCVGGETKYNQCDISSWSNIIQVSAGRYNSYGLKEDGTVLTTSNNDYGQANVSGWSDIVQVSSGTYHVLGLKSNGTVVCVGGQKGDNVCDVSTWSNIIQVVGAGYHSIGLKRDGTVIAVGNNDKGQLNVSDWNNVISISGGRYHTIGLTDEFTFLSVGLINRQADNNENKEEPELEEKTDSSGLIKFRHIGSSGYLDVLIHESGNGISDLKYLRDQYRLEFKSNKKSFLLKITTKENLEYIEQFTNQSKDSNSVIKDIYEEILEVIKVDQNGHENQVLSISIAEIIDDSDFNKGTTNWISVSDKYIVKDDFSRLFQSFGQVDVRSNGDLYTIYPGRFDISRYKTGTDLDLTYGFDYSYHLSDKLDSQHSNGAVLNIHSFVSSVNWSQWSSNLPHDFELNKTYYACNSVYSLDNTGTLIDSNTKLITTCAPFSLKSADFGLVLHPGMNNNGELKFDFAREWMYSKSNNNFIVEFVIKDLNYSSEAEKIITPNDKAFVIDVINELKDNLVINESSPEEFSVDITITALGVGDYLASVPFEFSLTLKKADFDK